MGCFNSRTSDQPPIRLQKEVIEGGGGAKEEEQKKGMERKNIEPIKVGKPPADPPVQNAKAKRNPEKIPEPLPIALSSPQPPPAPAPQPGSNKKPLEPNNDSINDMVSNWLNDIYKHSELLILSQV